MVLDLHGAYFEKQISMNEDNGVNQPSQKTAGPWMTAACIPHTITTTKGPNETQQEFCARHSAQVAADLIDLGIKEQSIKEAIFALKNQIPEKEFSLLLSAAETSPHWTN